MLKSKNNLVATVFIISILLFANLVRSDVIVDKSFLPRFLALTVILFFTYVFLFREKQILKHNFWTYSLCGLYLWNLISCLWATSVSEALMQAQLIFLGLAVFGIVATFNEENHGFERIFIRTHILVLLFSFVLAFYKISTLKFYDPYKISSISLNNNLYTGFLLLSFPVILTGYCLFKGTWKYISVITGILTLFFIIIIQTRATYLGLAFALIVTSFIVLLKYRRIISKRNIYTGLGALVLLFAAVFLFYNSLDSTRRNAFKSKVAVWNYFSSQDVDEKVVEPTKSSTQVSSQSVTPSVDIPVEYYENVNTRLIFWKKSVGLIKTHPLLGVGAGNWRIMIASVADPPNPEHTVRNYTYSQPHNEWIGFISELGILGFILVVLVFFVPIILILFRVIFIKAHPPVAVVFYTGFLAGFYIYASFDFPFKRVEHLVLFFSVFAFLFSKMPFAKDKELPVKGFFRSGSFPYIFIVLMAFSILLALARIKGEINTLKVFKNEKRNDRAVIQYCRQAGNNFYAVTPNTLPILWFEGVANFRLGNKDEALKCFGNALKSTPYEVRVLNDYGANWYALGNQEKSIEILKSCLRIDPYFDEAKFNLGAIYYSMSQPDSALYYINQCRDSQKKKDYLSEIQSVKIP